MIKNTISKPSRILFCSQTPFIAGGEINLLELIKTIDAQSFLPFLCYNPISHINSYLSNTNVKLLSFELPKYERKKVIKVFYAMLRILFILALNRICLVYANSIMEIKYFVPVCNLLRIPIIAHLHIKEEEETLRWLKIDKVNRIIFPSKATMIEVLKSSPWLGSDKCYFVHNAVDIETYKKKNSDALKEKLKLKDAVPIIGIVGRLREDKGQHLFLEMVSNLVRHGIKAKFIVVGEDNDQKGKYKDHLKKITEKLNISKIVTFIGFRSDIPEIMSLCDLLIVPSLKEPFGRVVIEAMACETPVIASAVDGILEIFRDGEGGLFFDKGSVDNLTTKVMYFFENPNWWDDQKKIARKVCKERFRQEIHTKRIERHMLEVIGKAHANFMDNE